MVKRKNDNDTDNSSPNKKNKQDDVENINVLIKKNTR